MAQDNVVKAVINDGLPADQAMSADGTRLYVSALDGNVRVYDVASGALLKTWDVGINLGAIDLSPDGSYLIVAERAELGNNGMTQHDRVTTVTVYRVDTQTGAVTSFPTSVYGFDRTFYDVAALAGNIVLLTGSSAATGSMDALWRLDLATGTYTNLQSPYIQEDSQLYASEDGAYGLVAPQNDGGHNLYIYQPAGGVTHSTRYFPNYYKNVLDVQAINSVAGLVVQSAGRLVLRDIQLNLLIVLSDLHPQLADDLITGLAFDRDGKNLYILDEGADVVTRISTADFSIVEVIPVGVDVRNSAEQFPEGDYGNQLLVSPDGRYLTVVTPGGIRVIDTRPDPDPIRGTAGDDAIDGTADDDAIEGLAGNDVIRALGGNDTIDGGAGDDSIDGGSGADRMTGGPGNDVYSVDVAGDQVVEAAGEGTDEIRTAVASYSLETLANVENLTGTSANTQVLTGNELGNVIVGGMGDDTLHGLGGNDVLVGFGGSDTLHGGAGDDVYIIDAGDTVVELAGDGRDEVRTQAEIFVLSDTLENLRATSDIGHDFRGNAGSNVIVGGDGNDILRLQDGGGDLVFGKGGVDSIYFGAAFDNDDFIDGGDNRDSLLLQGNYDLTLTWNITGASSIANVEGVSLLSGSIATYGDAANNRYSYDLTFVDGNVAAGALMKVNGFSLLAGENMAIDASAETDAALQMLAGLGRETLKGGALGDAFVFGHGGRFGAGDVVNGGGGYDVVYLRGDYTIDFNHADHAGSLAEVESIALLTSANTEFVAGGDGDFDYHLTWNDAMLAAGATMTVNGSRLQSYETFVFDGSQEASGVLRVFGGAAADTLTGGGGNDQLHGGGGADALTGGGGADLFRYSLTSDSTGSAFDTIHGFVAGQDRIDVNRVDARAATSGDNEAFAFIGASAFSAAGPGGPGELRAFNVSGGLWQVEGDVDGDGVADLVIQVHVEAGQPLTQGDFVL